MEDKERIEDWDTKKDKRLMNDGNTERKKIQFCNKTFMQ